jgi:Xaa-Pro aminopeptidase
MRDKKAILEIAREYDSDAIVFLDDSSRYWLTGFRSSAGIAIISKKETALILDGRYTEKAYSEKPDAVIYPSTKGLFADACEYILNNGFKSVLVDENKVSLAEFYRLRALLEDVKEKKVKVKHGKDLIGKFVSVKNEKEISYIKEAVRITDECFSHILTVIKNGITESDIAAEINYFFHKRGCENAFETIVVSGVKSSMPHGIPENIKLTPNSFITMDFGAKFKGYCADLTRTIVLGKANDEMKKIYDIVLEANVRGISAAKSGVNCKDVDKASRGYISSEGYGEYFTHSTGHSLGIDIHEAPSVSTFSADILKAGNVVTIEPGIYVPNKYGVRIEDTILITENETIVLSKSPKNLIEIEI